MQNFNLSRILKYILSDKKLTAIALVLSAFFIYQAGKSCGQFIHLILN